MVLSTEFTYWQGASAAAKYTDPSRIAAAVVAGIGFLAGGAIFREGMTVRGLTTAAGLWLVTAIGLCAGAGMFLTSGSVTLLGLFALAALRYLEDTREGRRLTVELSSPLDDLAGLEQQLDDLDVTLDVISEERVAEPSWKQILLLEIRSKRRTDFDRVVSRLCAAPSVRRVQLCRLHQDSQPP